MTMSHKTTSHHRRELYFIDLRLFFCCGLSSARMIWFSRIKHIWLYAEEVHTTRWYPYETAIQSTIIKSHHQTRHSVSRSLDEWMGTSLGNGYKEEKGDDEGDGFIPRCCFCCSPITLSCKGNHLAFIFTLSWEQYASQSPVPAKSTSTARTE